MNRVIKKVTAGLMCLALGMATVAVQEVYAADHTDMRAVWISTVYSADYPSKVNDAEAQKSEFISKLEQAQELGMTGTHFVNPDGIHKTNHYSSYQDLAVMAQLALENPTISKYTAINVDYVSFVSGEERKWENTNALVNPESPYYCPYALGLKTGQTPGAGACLLSAFRYQGRTLIIGTFGCPAVEDRFIDTLQLFNRALEMIQ